VPVGSVIAWPLTSLPSGSESGKWLECNGQAINGSHYPKLALLMSHTPDYRGVFLRGLGSTTSTHYNIVTHQSGALGELQGDSVRNVTGWFISQASDFDNSNNADQKLFKTIGSYNSRRKIGNADDWNKMIKFDMSKVVATSNENRPINIAVNYLIKAQ